MITPEGLTKCFGAFTAIEDVSFSVERGEIIGFLGPNGAGKTTTLRILAGVFPPSAGRALVDGLDLASARRGRRRRIGYAPEHPALHGEMTVRAELAYVAALRDVPAGGARSAAIDAAL